MSEAKSCSSSGVDDSASHQALLIQCLKSLADSFSANSIARCRRRSSENVADTVRGLLWEMRTLFNDSRLLARTLQRECTCCLPLVERGHARRRSRAISTTIGNEDASGTRRFKMHFYDRRDGSIGSNNGRLDPKLLVDDDNVAYKLLSSYIVPQWRS